jgi:uncharacterized membrane protein
MPKWAAMHGTGRPFALAVCAAAFFVQASLGLVTHRALGTNAFDLSVFDYAVWTSAGSGRLGYVPMFGHSLFAQHLMPTLLLLAPLSRVFGSPAYLIVTQTLCYAVAAYLLYLFAIRHTTSRLALALVVAFLLSRRSFSAVNSYFYIESAEPALVLGMLLAWSARRPGWYWVLLFLALGCKEDVACGIGAFGLMLTLSRNDRRLGVWTAIVAAAWLLLATLVVLPHWRHLYALSESNPFLQQRYALTTGRDVVDLLARTSSWNSFSAVLTLASTTAFMCFLAPAWAAVAVPGLLLVLAAAPGVGREGVVGHYLWPLLPWIFAAAVMGARRVPAPAMRWLPWMVMIVALIDMPLPRRLWSAPWRPQTQAQAVLKQLEAIPAQASVAAQPNLIPHLPRRLEMSSLGAYEDDQRTVDYVLMTSVGDLWPFDRNTVTTRIAAFAADGRYDQLSDGPLVIFSRRR